MTEWFAARRQVGRRIAGPRPMVGADDVQFELSKWTAREVSDEKGDQAIAFTETCVVADLDTATALLAAALCARHKLATADAIVYATARAHGADLLIDRHFENLPGVSFMRKRDE